MNDLYEIKLFKNHSWKKFIPNDDKLKKGDRKNDITNRYWSNEKIFPKESEQLGKERKK